LFLEVEQVLDELARSQQDKRLRAARRVLPAATADDVEQPHDFPSLANDPHFNYEDGVLAGILAAQIALRSRIFRHDER
jgi:hypothetical protein